MSIKYTNKTEFCKVFVYFYIIIVYHERKKTPRNHLQLVFVHLSVSGVDPYPISKHMNAGGIAFLFLEHAILYQGIEKLLLPTATP